MSKTVSNLDSVEEITGAIADAKEQAQKIKVELLQHYLLNYLLLLESKEEESPIKEELLTIAVLLEKVTNMEKKIQLSDSKRIASTEMMKNKGLGKKPKTTFRSSAKKFKDNYERMEKKKEEKGEKPAKPNKFG